MFQSKWQLRCRSMGSRSAFDRAEGTGSPRRVLPGTHFVSRYAANLETAFTSPSTDTDTPAGEYRKKTGQW